jgi:hypothetical protein
MVPDAQILEVVSLTDDPQEACELLIAEANDAGGTDNISALVVLITDPTKDAVVTVDHGEIETHETVDSSLDSLDLADTGDLDGLEGAALGGRLSDPLVDGCAGRGARGPRA